MGLGRRTFAPGEVLTASNVMNYLQDQAVMSFAGTAARGSAIGTAVAEGMVSYLQDTNAVEVYDGSAWKQVYPSVANTGEIIQVVSTLKTTSFSAASATFTDVTGLSVSITPKATANKVLVLANFYYGNNDSGQNCYFNLVRNSTNIAQSTGGLENCTVSPYTNNTVNGQMISIAFLDSPSTTSSITYKIQGRVGVGTFYVGRYATSANAPSSSTITVLEVAG